MSNLSYATKEFLEDVLQMRNGGGGGVLHFSNAGFDKFFQSLNINIYTEKYEKNGSSKANRMRTFWELENNIVVGKVILELANVIRNQELLHPTDAKFSAEVEKIGQKLLTMQDSVSASVITPTTINNNKIGIEIRPEIYKPIFKFLQSEHFFTAVEEAYKIVREKLKKITGDEKATDAFKQENAIKIFGHNPRTDAEKDFFDGVKYLNMAIQFLRNEKAHTPAYQLNKNLAIHYISLASLVYDLISRRDNE